MHSEPCQTSKMERFAKIVKGLTTFPKRSILDVWCMKLIIMISLKRNSLNWQEFIACLSCLSALASFLHKMPLYHKTSHAFGPLSFLDVFIPYLSYHFLCLLYFAWTPFIRTSCRNFGIRRETVTSFFQSSNQNNKSIRLYKSMTHIPKIFTFSYLKP